MNHRKGRFTHASLDRIRRAYEDRLLMFEDLRQG